VCCNAACDARNELQSTHLGPVEHPFLQVAPVSHLPNLSTQRINLMDQLTLGWAAHCWVAGLQGVGYRGVGTFFIIGGSKALQATQCLQRHRQTSSCWLLACHAIRSRFRVNRRVLQPSLADASAASHPACPPPTTMTSYSSSWSHWSWLLTCGLLVAEGAVAAARPTWQHVATEYRSKLLVCGVTSSNLDSDRGHRRRRDGVQVDTRISLQLFHRTLLLSLLYGSSKSQCISA
jgi:hypothetical protein